MTRQTTHRFIPRRPISVLASIIGALWLLLSGGAQAGCIDQKQLLGVNIAGAEFNAKRLPGVLNKDYVYPSPKDLAHFRDLGMNVVRVPIRWERIQQQPNAPLDPTELEQLRRVVNSARDLGLCTLIDLHNYGSHSGRVVGSADLPATAFIDVWLRLHQAFSDPNDAAFGLMNEPKAVPVPQWLTIAQDTVLALRNAGAKNLLMVGSGRWSGAHEWERSFDGVSAASEFRNFKDPLNNFAIELHQYADADYSGTTGTCIDAARLRTVMDKVTAWAKLEKKRLFLGEFGVADSPECLAALQVLLESMQDADAWLGWSYWAAGAWWGKYPFSIHPTTAREAGQLTVLRTFLPK